MVHFSFEPKVFFALFYQYKKHTRFLIIKKIMLNITYFSLNQVASLTNVNLLQDFYLVRLLPFLSK